MILDHRTYRLRVGALPEYLVLYEKEGYAAQSRHLGAPVGWFYTEIGPLNQVVHIWKYDDLADRDRKRAGLQADPEWQAFVAKAAPYIEHMENKILRPAPFSPLR